MLATLGERIYNEGREEGIEEGIEQGIEKGIKTGIQKGREEGIQTGMEKGREAERLEVAKNMLSGGLSIAQVARFTGLSEEVIIGFSYPMTKGNRE